MAYAEIARGLGDLKVAQFVAGTAGANVDVPGARSLSFNVESDVEELEGDNDIIAKARSPKSLSGSIEIGQINLAALAQMKGGTVATDGVTPDEIQSLEETSDDTTIYFQIIGQAPGVDAAGSAYRVTIYKCLATSGLDETMEVNSWNTPTLDFEGVKNDSNALLNREQYETEVAIA